MPAWCHSKAKIILQCKAKMKDFLINRTSFLLAEYLWQPWPKFHSVLYVQKLLCLCRCVAPRFSWPGTTHRPSSLLLMLCRYLGWNYPSSQYLSKKYTAPIAVLVFGVRLPLLAHPSLPCTGRCNDMILVPQQVTIFLWLDIIKNIYRAYCNLLMCCYIASSLFHFLYQLIKLLLYCAYIMQ